MSHTHSTRALMSGNEAIARGAWETGVTIATGYPGTPSTEILEFARSFKDDIYCEWAPNEKVALEVAAGASLAGARCIVTMKHVGLNVAADPLMTLAYIGTVGGLAVCVADDPGMHSSQNEQDTRHYARFAKVPILEPSDSQEAKDFLSLAMEISETHGTPVLLRSTTRVSHSSGAVSLGERRPSTRPVGFQKDPRKFVPIPLYARPMRVRLEERLAALAAAANSSAANRIEWGDRSVGIIAEGIAYQYVREIAPEASVLKIGWVWPFPDDLIRQFAAGVGKLIIVEELDPILEEHVRSLGIACEGKSLVPDIGELSADRLADALGRRVTRASAPVDEDLPARPPVLCPACPHRGIFHALGKFDVAVTGDIGCYSLGVFPPLKRIDTILCMGAGISMAHGMQKAAERRGGRARGDGGPARGKAQQGRGDRGGLHVLPFRYHRASGHRVQQGRRHDHRRGQPHHGHDRPPGAPGHRAHPAGRGHHQRNRGGFRAGVRNEEHRDRGPLRPQGNLGGHSHGPPVRGAVADRRPLAVSRCPRRRIPARLGRWTRSCAGSARPASSSAAPPSSG